MSARDAATRQAAVVNAVEVVVDEVALELPLEPRVARIQVAGEGGAPALREDRLVQGLDVPVRLRTSGVDVRDPGAQALERRVEERTLELVAVVGEDALEPPAGGLELARDPAGELRGLLGGRVALPADDELGPGEGGVDVDRAQLPDRALAAAQAPDVETVDADQLARAGARPRCAARRSAPRAQQLAPSASRRARRTRSGRRRAAGRERAPP